MDAWPDDPIVHERVAAGMATGTQECMMFLQRKLEVDRGRPVAFICRSGARSATATRTALDAGYDALNVKGGVIAWERAGLPLSRKQIR